MNFELCAGGLVVREGIPHNSNYTLPHPDSRLAGESQLFLRNKIEKGLRAVQARTPVRRRLSPLNVKWGKGPPDNECLFFMTFLWNEDENHFVCKGTLRAEAQSRL